MLCFSFNHFIFDSPYNQKAVSKGLNELSKYIDEMNEKPIYSFGEKRNDLYFGVEDEVVNVYHDCDLSSEQKKAIVEIVSRILTLLKANAQEMGDKCIIFNKKDAEDVFLY